MSEQFFAEATVQIAPDVRGFAGKLEGLLKKELREVEKKANNATKVKIAPALTRDFRGDLTRQVNVAVAKIKPNPVLISAVLSKRAARQIQAQLNTLQATAPAGGGARSTQVSQGTTAARNAGASASKVAATAAAKQTAAESALNRALTAQRAILTAGASATTETARVKAQIARTELAFRKATEASTIAIQKGERAIAKQALALRSSLRAQLRDSEAMLSRATAADLLVVAEARLAEVQIAGIGATTASAIAHARAQAAETAHAASSRAVSAAIASGDSALIGRATALAASSGALARENVLLAENQRQLRGTARSHAQASKGALSTSLSFLGVRGATLAASASFLVGAAAIAVFAKAIGATANFEEQLNVFRATASATADEMDRVRESARALGADITLPAVTSADAAEAMVELAKAGLSVEDAIAGARGVLQLATAAAIDNAKAVEIAASALNAFGLSGRDAVRVADVFANAANEAQGSIADIGIAFQQAAAAGRQVGLSFEDTSLFLTVLARNGLRGSDAGTSLRTALLRLVKPSAAAREKLKELNIEIRDAAGNVRPDIFIQISAALEGMGPAARDATIGLLGGADAFRAISILGRQSIGDFIKLRQQLREQGTASELAKARTQGLRGAVDALGSTLETIGVQAGRSLTPALQGLVQNLTLGVSALSNSAQTAGILSGVMESLGLAFEGVKVQLQLIAPLLQTAAQVAGALTNAVGVPTILAGVLAYKLLAAAISSSRNGMIGMLALRTAESVAIAKNIGLVVAESAALQGVSRARVGLQAATAAAGALATSLPLIGIAAAAAAAGLFFLITRETEAERTTRKLEEASKGLASALAEQREAAQSAGLAGRSVNAAQLGIVEARQAAGAARTAVANSKAAKGSFERRKLELQLAVAIDNVAIAEQRAADAVREAAESKERLAGSTEKARKAMGDERRALEGIIDATRNQQRARGRLGRGPGGQEAAALGLEVRTRDAVVKKIKEQIVANRDENTNFTNFIAKRQELLLRFIQITGKVPDKLTISLAFQGENVTDAARKIIEGLRKAGKDGAANAVQAAFFGFQELGPRLKAYIDGPARSQLIKGMKDAGGDAGKAGGESLVQQFVKAANQAGGKAKGLESQLDVITIAGGGDAARRAGLVAIQRQRQSELDSVMAAIAAGTETPTLRKRKREAQAALAQVIEEIRGIDEQMASDVKAAADEATRKQEERDSNFLALLGVSRDRRSEAIQNAALTEGVQDDIRANRAIFKFLDTQIKLIFQRLGKTKVALTAVRELRAIQRDLDRDLKSLNTTKRQERRDRIAERNQLDIDFAVTTENTSLEIRARQREINRLTKLQNLTREGSLQWRRYRNLIEEQRQAIEDARGKTKEKNDAFKRLTFEFLQKQQGFASNLLGNLIPLGATGGLVGNASPGPVPGAAGGGPSLGAGAVDRSIQEKGALAAAQGAGPTKGQATVEIDLLRQIVRILGEIRSGKSHPEAKNAKKLGGSGVDTR